MASADKFVANHDKMPGYPRERRYYSVEMKVGSQHVWKSKQEKNDLIALMAVYGNFKPA